MWTAITGVLGFLKAFFGWREEEAINKRLGEAKKAGADAAHVKGSKEVDKLILDAEQAKNAVSHTEEDIVNDPRNRAKPRK